MSVVVDGFPFVVELILVMQLTQSGNFQVLKLGFAAVIILGCQAIAGTARQAIWVRCRPSRSSVIVGTVWGLGESSNGL
jgi:hypothetical protein